VRRFEKREQAMNRWRVAVVVRTKTGILCHQNPRDRFPLWKLIDGMSEGADADWRDTVIRELAEEVGLRTTREDLCLLAEVNQRGQSLYVCEAIIPGSELKWHRAVGDKGEAIRSISLPELATAPDFYDLHREVLLKAA
jgi:hypothetical protein